MKKIISVFLAILCMLSFSVTSFAVNTSVSADDVETDPGNAFEIVYKIKDNKGLMGCSFILDYDKTAFEIISIQKGTVLAGGMFNDSIGTSKENLKIIWSSAENVYGDGEIFTVTVKAKDTASGSYKFRLSSEKDDTFNESWEDVRIDCGTVNVKVGNDTHVSFWTKIANFFKNIYNFIISIFK